MKHELIEDGASRKTFRVELTPQEVRHAREHAEHHLQAHLDLPGFRKGKVPSAVLASRYGKQLQEETVEHALGHAAGDILRATGLQPITNPTVTHLQHAGDAMSFHLAIELAPQITLPEYRGLALRQEAVHLRPEDVDSVVEGLRRRMASYAPADRPIRWGDLAVIDYDGRIDGRPFEGGTHPDVAVFVGGRETLRELEEALVGRKAGETFTAAVTYPADHANRDLAGKPASFSVTVKEVKAGKLPDLDDAFAKAAGDHATLEDLRRSVVDRLRAEREKEARDRLRAQAADRLLKAAPADVAPSLVEEEMQYMAVRGAEELARQGLKQLEQLRMNPKDFRELFRPAAVRAVREAFVLESIAERESIAVSDEDLEAEIRKGRAADAVSDRLIGQLKADGRWERLRTRLRHDRTLDWVIGQAAVTVGDPVP